MVQGMAVRAAVTSPSASAPSPTPTPPAPPRASGPPPIPAASAAPAPAPEITQVSASPRVSAIADLPPADPFAG